MPENTCDAEKRYFNSIKVRLKPCRVKKRCSVLLFQFHKGTIKTNRLVETSKRMRVFQFHKGTIKTWPYRHAARCRPSISIP